MPCWQNLKFMLEFRSGFAQTLLRNRRETDACNVPETGRSKLLCHDVLKTRERIGNHSTQHLTARNEFGRTCRRHRI